MRSAFWLLFVLLKTNQYKKNTMGKKMAKAKELKNIIYFKKLHANFESAKKRIIL
jgi:hypothetical protein